MTDYIPSMSQVEAWLDEPLYVTEAEIGKLRQLYSIDDRRLQRLVQQIAADVAQNLQVLAQPEPEGPTDEEWDAVVERTWNKYRTSGYQGEKFVYEVDFDSALNYARAVLARWGNHRGILDSSPQPPSGEVAGLVARPQDCQSMPLSEERETFTDLLARPNPPQPTDSEVAELVAWLHTMSELAGEYNPEEQRRYTRAAELLEQLSPPQPVSVIDRLPKPETKVLAHYFNDLGNGRTICAIWVPAKTRCDSTGDDDFTEYDEDEDKFYWPEGWYEAIENWDDFGWVKVNEGEVMYWQPLPQWPTLPLPSGEAK